MSPDRVLQRYTVNSTAFQVVALNLGRKHIEDVETAQLAVELVKLQSPDIVPSGIQRQKEVERLARQGSHLAARVNGKAAGHIVMAGHRTKSRERGCNRIDLVGYNPTGTSRAIAATVMHHLALHGRKDFLAATADTQLESFYREIGFADWHRPTSEGPALWVLRSVLKDQTAQMQAKLGVVPVPA